MFLCVFLDLYSRRVVGWSLEDHMRAPLVVQAWKNALETRRDIEALIVHSDRGIQYCCEEFRETIKTDRRFDVGRASTIHQPPQFFKFRRRPHPRFVNLV